MANIDISEYAKMLCSKIDGAAQLNRAVVKIGNWTPQSNNCHSNVTIWCEHNPDYMPVRGWLYFDKLSKFIAHSAVKTSEGKLYDITPSFFASQNYPFIEGGLSHEDYADLVETQGRSEIKV